jgi:hypothetical protein
MAVPLGTPWTQDIVDNDGERESRTMWPAGVDGLALTPQESDEHRGKWCVIHRDSGRLLALARDMHTALHLARSLGYACGGRQAGDLSRITSDPKTVAACNKVVRDFR